MFTSNKTFLRWISGSAVIILTIAGLCIYRVNHNKQQYKQQAINQLNKFASDAIQRSVDQISSFEFDDALQNIKSNVERLESSQWSYCVVDARKQLWDQLSHIKSEKQQYEHRLAQGWTMFENRFISPEERNLKIQEKNLAEQKIQERNNNPIITTQEIIDLNQTLAAIDLQIITSGEIIDLMQDRKENWRKGHKGHLILRGKNLIISGYVHSLDPPDTTDPNWAVSLVPDRDRVLRPLESFQFVYINGHESDLATIGNYAIFKVVNYDNKTEDSTRITKRDIYDLASKIDTKQIAIEGQQFGQQTPVSQGGFVKLFLVLLAILFPAVIATARGHNNLLVITVCSLLGLVTFGILWFIAFIWSFTDNTKKTDSRRASSFYS